jgi:hypothetical protein
MPKGLFALLVKVACRPCPKRLDGAAGASEGRAPNLLGPDHLRQWGEAVARAHKLEAAGGYYSL